MTLIQIEYFLEVCKTMNFTKAAHNLFVSQPSLSRQISQLENELGVKLIQRTNRSVILTNAGELFKCEFERIIKQIDMAVQKVKTSQLENNELNIGIFYGLSPQDISILFEKMTEFFDDYKIYIHKYNSFDLKNAFESGSLDLLVEMDGCNFAEPEDFSCKISEMPAYFIFSDKMFSKEHFPLCLSDFNGKKLICFQDKRTEQLTNFQIDMVTRLGIQPAEIIRTDNVIASLLYTECMDGFSVWRNESLEGVLSWPVPDNLETFSTYACWKKSKAGCLTEFFQKYYNYSLLK